jgi:hypothetical protein
LDLSAAGWSAASRSGAVRDFRSRPAVDLAKEYLYSKASDAEQLRILIFVFAGMKSAARTPGAMQPQQIKFCERLFAAGYHKERSSFW